MSLYTTKNSEYLEKNQSWHIEDSPWKAQQIFSLLKKNNLHPNSIVEIGCGAGEILCQLKNLINNENLKFDGYDISPDVTSFWDSRRSSQISFFQKNLLDTNAYYDVLLMIDVFEHVEDYFSFIKSASNRATYKVYHIPLDISVIGVMRNMQMEAREKVGHLHYFTKDAAIATLKECGQEIIDSTYTHGAEELSDKKMRTRFLNIIRKIFFRISPDLTTRWLGGYSLIVLTK